MQVPNTHTGATLLIASLAGQGVGTVFLHVRTDPEHINPSDSIGSTRKNSNVRPVTDLSIAP